MAQYNKIREYNEKMSEYITELSSNIKMILRRNEDDRDYLLGILGSMKELCENIGAAAAETEPIQPAPADRSLPDKAYPDITLPGKYTYDFTQRNGSARITGTIIRSGNAFTLLKGSKVLITDNTISDSAAQIRDELLNKEPDLKDGVLTVSTDDFIIMKGASTLCTLIFGYSTSYNSCVKRFTAAE